MTDAAPPLTTGPADPSEDSLRPATLPTVPTVPTVPGADGPSVAPAPATRRRWPLFLALAAAVVVADQGAKSLVTTSLAPGQSVDIVGDTVRIVFGQNSGALFGLFKDNAAMFGVVSLIVVGLIALYHARAAGTPYLTVTLGLLLGGAVGNMLDRLRLGYVVDFVDAGIGTFRFYTFNIADSAISVAILMLFIAAIRPSLVEGQGSRPTAPSSRATTRGGAAATNDDDDDWADDGEARP